MLPVARPEKKSWRKSVMVLRSRVNGWLALGGESRHARPPGRFVRAKRSHHAGPSLPHQRNQKTPDTNGFAGSSFQIPVVRSAPLHVRHAPPAVSYTHL